ncbi:MULTISPECIES: DUF2812 domain-containing protein [Exiguobacterium]|uniref:DUF2812 domain-containing protein n=1 Tax=Exiguobacterium TaxID=33986 RepID=UPI001BE6D81A|nr:MULTISPECIES: DUF2812 domain-containing protein [Exiguobacterium]MCT4782006.1 DUF2812 domain-containing protein [Exiguobacterium himgiriensis]
MKRKYMSSWGLAFAEEREMRKLEKMAKQGWHLEKFAPLGYSLVKGEPADVQYSLDYRTRPDEEYFEMFASSGWEHVTSTGDEIHIFKGHPGARPIYSDRETMVTKYATEERTMGRAALTLLIVWLGLWIIMQLDWSSVMATALLMVHLLITIGLIFTGLPYLGFLAKRKRMERDS